tara:strand:- start:424 stop:624 length:201 start_codon:yes stop_codon:yes gene_type:complete
MITKNKKTTDIKKVRSELIDLKKALLNLKFQKSIGQLEKTSEIKKTRRKISQLKTVISNDIGATNA